MQGGQGVVQQTAGSGYRIHNKRLDETPATMGDLRRALGSTEDLWCCMAEP